MKKVIRDVFITGMAIMPYYGDAQTVVAKNKNFANVTFISNPEVKLIRANPTDVFSKNFVATATGKNDINTYLLCYLSTLIYPQYLAMVANNSTDAYDNKLHTQPAFFEAEYKKYISHLFTNPIIKFFRKSDRLGYDPEAMVISTASTNFIVFRGTDRVGSNGSGFLYDFAEWITTDFDARQISSPNLTGKVISGMWRSLEYEGFNQELFDFIVANGGTSKKLWITGHSLGAGQAQLFAMYAAKKGITAQGVYGFAAPNPGNQQFATEMDRIFPNSRFQRFEFVTDPITVLSSAVGYVPAGTRVYYNDIASIEFNKAERSYADVANIIPGIIGAVGNGIADFINEGSGGRLQLDNLLGNSTMCYHHPTWYLKAAYQQLSATERANVPIPLDLPLSGSEGCDASTVKRGKKADQNLFEWANAKVTGAIETVAQATDETIKTINFAANTIISNVTGSALTEGNYYIKSYASPQQLGLNEQNGFESGSDLRLTTARSKVNIRRFGAIGYTIEFGVKTVEGWFGPETKRYVLDSEGASLYQSGSSEIQLWEKNNFPLVSANQRWLFIQLEGNKYLIKNLENGKVLDANNDNINTSSCRVKTYQPVNNDQTQIWVLEKVN